MADMEVVSDYEKAVKCLRTCLTDLAEMRDMMTRLEKEGSLDMLFTMMNTFLKRGGIQDHELEKVPVIHIAGTKGKGSTSAFTESILRHHGYRTGLFTSPHMYQVRERICINGRPISRQKFCHYFWGVFKKFEESVFESSIEEGGTMPGFFDLMTVMAMRVFISEHVDVVILEVGKGGYTDRTNFVREPVVCGITSLALEHTESLGSTIEKIAWHKAGIIKTGRPIITLPQDPKALQVILDISKQKKAPVYVAMPLTQTVLDQYCFTLGIKGPVQVQNGGLAVQLFRAWEAWKGVTKPELVNGVTRISSTEDIPRLTCATLEMNVIKGLTSCVLHGRTEIIHRDHVTYYLDCAHTQESMEHCVAWFEKAASAEAASMSGKKVARVLKFYCSSVKNPQKLLHILKVHYYGDTLCEQAFNEDMAEVTSTATFTLERSRATLLSAMSCSFTKSANFDGAAFCWIKASEDEPLGQHSDQRYAKVDPSYEDTLVGNMKSAWESLPSMSSDVHKLGEQFHHEHGFFKNHYSNIDDTVCLKLDSLGLDRCNFSQKNDDDPEHRSTNGYDSYPNGTVASEQDPLKFNILKLASEPGIYFPDCDTGTLSTNDQHCLLANGKIIQNHVKGGQGSQTFDCPLKALVWATQDKDPAVASCVKVPRELLPIAPLSMREANHIQVLVTGCFKLVGVVLSIVLPNMND